MARPKKQKKEEEVKQFGSVKDAFFYESGEHVRAKWGDEMVSSAMEEDKDLKYLAVPDLSLQWALGRKGFALKRIAYIVGFEGATKTSLALWMANLAFEQGGLAAMIETEQAGSSKHMRYYLGDNAEKFRVFHPETIEDAMKMTIDMLKTFERLDPEAKLPKVLILDSLGGSSDERFEESVDSTKGEIAVPKVGGSAKLIKDYTNSIKNLIKKTNTLWIVINQGRDKISTGFEAMLPVAKIDKVVASGGRAIPFHATYYIIVEKTKTIKDGDVKVGQKSKITFKKNKLGIPMGEVVYSVVYKETLNFYEDTMAFLLSGEICDIQKTPRGLYFSDTLGVPKESAMKPEAMYKHIHSPEWIGIVQEELEIDTSDECLIYVEEEEEQVAIPEQEEPAPAIEPHEE